MTVWLIISLLYIAVCVGLLQRGTGGKEISPGWPEGRPRLIFSPTQWLEDNGYFYIQDRLIYPWILTPLYTIPAIWYFQPVTIINPYWLVPIWAFGVFIGGLTGWRLWYGFDNSFGVDYRAGLIRMAHYAALFIPLGYVSGNLLEGFVATAVYALLAPLAYWFRAKNEWFRNWTRYVSQYAEASHALLYTLLGAWVVL